MRVKMQCTSATTRHSHFLASTQDISEKQQQTTTKLLQTMQ